MSETLAAVLAALPGTAALVAGVVRWKAWRVPRKAARRVPLGVRGATLVAIAAALAACHSIDEGAFATGPVPLANLPFEEPVVFSVGPSAGAVVPSQHGLLGSYYSGAAYVQPGHEEILDHQRIDPNVNFIWDASDSNPVIPPPAGIDSSEGDPRLPDHWPIWSVVWEGYLEPPVPGEYGLRLHLNNGGWLEMKNDAGGLQTIIDCPGGSSFEGDCDTVVRLAAGRRYVRISYYNNAPPTAVAIWSWRKPGDVDYGVVPPDVLFTQSRGSNTAPLVELAVGATIFAGESLTVEGSFDDPDAGDGWIATVDYGDGTGVHPLGFTAERRFTLTRRYERYGAYPITVVVTDRQGSMGRAVLALTVKRLPVIFVPGIFGTELSATATGTSVPIDNGHGGTSRIDYPGFGGNPVWLNLAQALVPGEEDYFDLLKFDSTGTGPLVPAIEQNGRLLKLPSTPYVDTEEYFKGQGYRSGEDLFLFPYDWRYPSARIAGLLDTKVSEILASTSAPKVDIVAHSQGGLVLRAFLIAGSQRERVNHVVMLGAPQLGTPLFGYGLLGGTCMPLLSDQLNCLIGAAETADVSRTIPSGVELGPSAEYYRVFPNVVSDVGDQHPVAYIDNRFDAPGEPRLNGTRQAFLDREREAGVPPGNISGGDAFHSDDRTWFGAIPSSVKLSLVVGTGTATVGQVIERWTRITVPIRDINGLIVGQTVKLLPQLDVRWVDGDWRVVAQSASLAESASRPANVTVVYAYWTHEGLPTARALPIATALLRDEDPTTASPVLAYRDGRRPTAEILEVHSPAEIQFSDRTGRRIGSTDGRGAVGEIEGALYNRIGDMKVISLPSPTEGRLVARGTADGEALIRVRQLVDGTMAREIVFAHVPTRPGSIAVVVFGPTGAAGLLAVDLDGDGITDRTVQPTVLEGASADDLTPPTIRLDLPDTRTVVGGVRVRWTASDALSGVASSVATLDGNNDAPYGPGDLVQVTPGIHRVDVFAEDRAGNFATTSRTFVADAHEWFEPLAGTKVLRANAGRTVPVKFAVRDAGGALVRDGTVKVALVAQDGSVVVGPLSASSSPADGVAILADAYHANLPTSNVPSGRYHIRVTFDSNTLVGEFGLDLTLE